MFQEAALLYLANFYLFVLNGLICKQNWRRLKMPAFDFCGLFMMISLIKFS